MQSKASEDLEIAAAHTWLTDGLKELHAKLDIHDDILLVLHALREETYFKQQQTNDRILNLQNKFDLLDQRNKQLEEENLRLRQESRLLRKDKQAKVQLQENLGVVITQLRTEISALRTSRDDLKKKTLLLPEVSPQHEDNIAQTESLDLDTNMIITPAGTHSEYPPGERRQLHEPQTSIQRKVAKLHSKVNGVEQWSQTSLTPGSIRALREASQSSRPARRHYSRPSIGVKSAFSADCEARSDSPYPGNISESSLTLKDFCVHWLEYGNCLYEDEAKKCWKHHYMPSQDILQNMGYSQVPGWYQRSPD